MKNSQWNKRAKGFENVSAQQAKISGAFTHPFNFGEGDGTRSAAPDKSVFVSQSRIDPCDSVSARTVILRGIDAARNSSSLAIQHIEDFLCLVDSPGTDLEKNIESESRAHDNSAIIIVLKSCESATIALAMNGLAFNNEVLSLARPGEYVVQSLEPYTEPPEDIFRHVKDSPRKITVKTGPEVNQHELLELLRGIAPLAGFEFLRKLGTKDATGITFVEFFVDPKVTPGTKDAINELATYLEKVQLLPLVEQAYFSCITYSDGKLTSAVQDCPTNMKTLRALVHNEYVAFHPKLCVLQLINAVTPQDLADDSNYTFISEDIRNEALTFGKIQSFVMPRPGEYASEAVPGLGKIYIEFEDESVALSALVGLSGRCYNDRTVLCAFYSEHDFRLGIL